MRKSTFFYYKMSNSKVIWIQEHYKNTYIPTYFSQLAFTLLYDEVGKLDL